MRDLLTFLAGAVILILVAAVVAPPFVDWSAHRDLVDDAISRAAGAEAVTEGEIRVRLLPSPRLTITRLRLGAPDPGRVSLDAHYVKAEIGLAPLLHGEVRFLESRAGRIEIKLPTGAGGEWRAPRTLLADDVLRRAWVFENLSVSQLLVTTQDPATGRTDQLYAEGVRAQAQSLAGPWRVEGTLDGTPFALSTGDIRPDAATSLKLSAGGGASPRGSLDGRLTLAPGPADTLVPDLSGTLKLSAAPEDGSPLAATATASFKAAGRMAELDEIAIEAGEGGAALRLSGAGRLDLGAQTLSLTLEGRRLDLDGLMARAPDGSWDRIRARLPFPIATTLRLDGVTLRGEELSGVSARGILSGDRLALERAEATLPGASLLVLSGEFGLVPGADRSGRVSVTSKAADRLGAFLNAAGLAPAGLLGTGVLDASAEFVAAHPVTSLRNLRVRLGPASLTGAVRYTEAEAGARPRLDAQIAVQGLDLTAIPSVPSLFDATRAQDLGLTLDARGVGYGAGEAGGRIAARITSAGSSLSIERLEIADLAGANASLSGTLEPGGGGRIAGRVTARRAAPLVDLVGRFGLGAPTALLPAFLREGALDLTVTSERSGTDLVTKLAGTAAGGPLSADIVTADGRVKTFEATIAAGSASAWLGQPASGNQPAAAARPSRLQASASRDAAGRLQARVAGEIGGLRIATTRPFAFGPDDDTPEEGEVDLASDDLGPILGAAGPAGTAPVTLALHARLARVTGVPRVTASGRIAGSDVEADLFGASRMELGGAVTLGRLSLPWVASAFALNLGAPPSAIGAGGAWSTARFGPPAAPALGGVVSVKAGSVDLGRGLSGTGARFTLATVPDGFAIRDLDAGFLGGRLRGGVTFTRQGGLAALIGEGSLLDVPLPALVGPPFTGGRLSGMLRFGGSGESVAGIVANLGGAGTLDAEALQIAGAAPGAVERAAGRALRSEDPLNQPRLAAVTAEELGRGPFAAGKASGSATLVAGALRVTPLSAEADAAEWRGSAAFDIRQMSLDLRGALSAKTLPRGWAGAPPYVTLGWAGPVGRPERVLDVGPLANGLASVVLARELDRIETFDLDAAERARLNARIDMDRARKAAAEEAARQARLREEAAERARLEEKARLEVEAGRAELQRLLDPDRIRSVTDGGPPRSAPAIPPAEIRPPSGPSGG